MNRGINKLNIVGGFGFQFFATNVIIVMGFISVLSIISLVLFALAASRGWTEDSNTLEKYGWSQINGQRSSLTYNGLTLLGDFEAVQYIGLKGAYTIINVVGNTTVQGIPGFYIKAGTIPEIQRWIAFDDSTLCPTANCPTCNNAGLAVVKLVGISTALSFFVLVVTVMRAALFDSLLKKIVALCLSFIATALSVAAFSTWHISCILKSKSTAQLSNATFEDKFGYRATAGGFVVMGIAMVLHLITPLRTDKSHLNVQALASPLFGNDGGFQKSDKATDFGMAGATELSPQKSNPASTSTNSTVVIDDHA